MLRLPSYVCSLLFAQIIVCTHSHPGTAPQCGERSFGVPGVNASFDYVIVGGGTAGLTVASRLAKHPSLSVAVIEAGGFYEANDGNISVVPGYGVAYAGTDPKDSNPLVDWQLTMVPQAVRIPSGTFRR